MEFRMEWICKFHIQKNVYLSGVNVINISKLNENLLGRIQANKLFFWAHYFESLFEY